MYLFNLKSKARVDCKSMSTIIMRRIKLSYIGGRRSFTRLQQISISKDECCCKSLLSTSNTYINRRHIQCANSYRPFSSATNITDIPPAARSRGQRVWKSEPNNIINEHGQQAITQQQHWNIAVDDVKDRSIVDESLSRICEQVCCKR